MVYLFPFQQRPEALPRLLMDSNTVGRCYLKVCYLLRLQGNVNYFTLYSKF